VDDPSNPTWKGNEWMPLGKDHQSGGHKQKTRKSLMFTCKGSRLRRAVPAESKALGNEKENTVQNGR